MLAFEAMVSGGQVGSAIADQPEECVEMLCELASDLGKDDLEHVQDGLRDLSLYKAGQVKELLQNLLKAFGDAA